MTVTQVVSTADPKKRIQGGLLDPGMLWKSLPDALRKLDPRTLWRNPVMFIVELGAVWSTILAILDPNWFGWLIVVWLWLTVVFANLAEAVAEGRGKAQAETLRKTKADTMARRLIGWRPGEPGAEEPVAAPLLNQGDIVVVEAGQVIPGDGEVMEGIASVDESAITGESAPVIRESGGDRSAVTGGTTVLSDRIVVQITQKPGESFIDRMIALVEGANRQKTPNEIALNILLAALTIIFVFAVATLQPLAIYSKANNPGVPDSLALTGDGVSGIVMVALLVCLIPTTIGALLSAIGIAGMDRLVQRNVLAMSGRAVEAAGCHVGQVEGGCTRAAQAGGFLRELLEDRQVGVDVAELAIGETSADQGVGEAQALGDADAAVVEEGAGALGGGEQLVAVRVEDDGLLDHALARQGDGDRVLGKAVDEVGGAVERVDDPLVLGVGLRAGLAGLFC